VAEADAGYITASQAAARTGYSKQHILRLLKAGKLDGRQIGSFWVTTVAAVDAYLMTHPMPGRPPGKGRSR
jgi:excisionase family DNA binding protein